MAGFREYAPGQVWFYYNARATKGSEEKNELGSCTSRPVVIIQEAFYPEWNDIVTVCPMTTSDRRSGVHIDGTVLKDGSFIEGGTVLPYLFYNVKTKFLFPIIAANHKRKLITLSDEDFQKVKEGYLYHLGVIQDPPDYVKEWKHLDDFDRKTMVNQIRLAIYDWEDTLARSHSNHPSDSPRKQENPILIQRKDGGNKPQENFVENHVLASRDRMDRSTGIIYKEEDSFNTNRLNTPKRHKKSYTIRNEFQKMTPSEFSDELGGLMSGIFPVDCHHIVYPGSSALSGIALRDMVSALPQEDCIYMLNMSISDIMKNTGIGSTTQASRFRKELRRRDWNGSVRLDESTNMMEFLQWDWPDGFHYSGCGSITKSRLRKNAKRRKVLFQLSIDEQKSLLELTDSEVAKRTGLPESYSHSIKEDILIMHPQWTSSSSPKKGISSSTLFSLNDIMQWIAAYTPETLYRLGQLLSPAECLAIRNISNKNLKNVCREYNLSMDKAQKLKATLVMDPSQDARKMDPDVCATAVRCIVYRDDGTVNDEMFYAFSKMDMAAILSEMAKLSIANIPNKATISQIKKLIRTKLSQ